MALAARLRSECDGLKGPPKSSRDDPDFVRNFHKYSRLHFIGSWRARIEALMASAAGSQGPAPQRPSATHPRTIIHLDMDCFFASVSEVAHPVLKGKPVAVSHSASASGTGEVSTCNYEARKYGVRSGMWISQAKELCPALVVVPYMFAEYESVSEKVYRTLLRRTSCVEALSCDEAYLDVTGLGDPEQLAAEMRAEIQAATGCTASAGIGPNLLMARIASERAKPNGQMRIHGGSQALEFLQALPVDALPGVGWATREQLKGHGIARVADLQARSRAFLQGLLGQRQGAVLWDFAQGRDSRPVEPFKLRKSVGAEVNYGLRFATQDDAWRVLDDLAGEVQERLRRAGVKGRTVTLKLKRKKPGAVEPAKFLGHGECDSFSKSASLARFTDVAADIARESRALLLSFQVPPAEIRGLGIQVTKLDNDGASARPGGAAPAKLAAFLQLGQQQAAERQEEQQAEARQQQQHEQEQQPAAAEALPHWVEPGLADASTTQQGAAPPQALPASQRPERQQEQPQPEQRNEQASSQVLAQGEPGMQDRSVAGGPSPAKQESLERCLARAAAQSQGAEELVAEQRQRLLRQWQGVSLSQMDADALQALPYEVQRELVAPGGGQQHPPWALDLPGTGVQHGPAAEAGGGAGGAEAGAAELDARAKGKRPPVEREQASGGEGQGGVAAAAPGGEHPTPLAASKDRQQQEAGWAGGDAGAGGSRAAAQRAPRPVPLPALSQLDPAVLDALPLSMRRELEIAYGIGKHSLRPASAPAHARRGARGGGGSGVHGAGTMAGHVSKRQRLDSFLSNPLPFGTSVQGQAAAASQPQQPQQWKQEAAQLSFSQLDPGVLQELPPEVRQEVLQQLQQRSGGGKGIATARHRQPQRSRFGQQRDEEQAWQRRWLEEQAMREAEEAAAASGLPPGGGACSEAAWLDEEPSQACTGQGADPPPVPPAVELFLQQAAQAGSVPSLAAALAGCLQELEEQLLSGAAASLPAQQEGQLSSEQRANQRSGSSSADCPSSGSPASLEGDSRVGRDGAAGVGGTHVELPPTQPVQEAGAERRPGSAGATAAPSPQQDSMQRIRGQQRAAAGNASPSPAASPAAATAAASRGGSLTAPVHSQIPHALKLLRRCLQQAAAELLLMRDLEQLRQLLRAVLRLGAAYPWFAKGGGEAVAAAAQRSVRAQYGWPLRLAGLLDARTGGARSEPVDAAALQQ